MTVRRSNPEAFTVLAERLRELDGKAAKAGWFESAVYEDGTSIAYVASIQEFGVTIHHPGGTPYFVTSDGSAHFVRKNTAFANGLPVTKPHTIIIPARPFMRPTIAREKNKWLEYMAQGSRAILAGNSTPDQVMNTIALRMAADVKTTISQITEPALAKSTIRKRMAGRSDKSTIGNLDKPLVHKGLLLATVTGKVEDTNNADSG